MPAVSVRCRWIVAAAVFVAACALLSCPGQTARAGDGALDAGFAAGQGASDDIYALAALPGAEGIIIAGHFTSYDGRERWRLARLRADGSLDDGFDPGDSAGSAPVNRVLPLADGRLLVAGPFQRFAGQRRMGLARLLADGKLDAGFDPNGAIGPGSFVNALLAAPGADGAVLAAGRLEPTVKGRAARAQALVRLKANGSPDDKFIAAVTLDTGDDAIRALALLPDGKLLVAGNFVAGADGEPQIIARLGADGQLDETFHPPTGLLGKVTALAVQDDGKILLGFAKGRGGSGRWAVVRLNADGSADANLGGQPSTGEADDGGVEALAALPDGKVLLGGGNFVFGDVRRKGVARLNADGTLDPAFDPGAGITVIPFDDPDETPEAVVHALLPLPGGKVIAAGRFDLYNGAPCHNIVRVVNGGQ